MDKKEIINDISTVFKMIKDQCMYNEDQSANMDSILKRVLARGITEDVLKTTVAQYE